VAKDDAAFGGQLRSKELAAVTSQRDAHFETVRSKRIAHNDLPIMQQRWGGKPVPGCPSREHIGELLRLVADLMNAVDQHYTGSQMQYALVTDDGIYEPHNLFPGRDGEQLARVLQQFTQWHDAELRASRRLLPAIAPALRPSTGPA
jgi:hypothetical protein